LRPAATLWDHTQFLDSLLSATPAPESCHSTLPQKNVASMTYIPSTLMSTHMAEHGIMAGSCQKLRKGAIPVPVATKILSNSIGFAFDLHRKFKISERKMFLQQKCFTPWNLQYRAFI
jgi:hypothetical protein